MSVGGHSFTYVSSRVVDEANRREVRAGIRIDEGQVFEPSMNQYLTTGKVIPRPSVDVTPTRDLYLNLTKEPEADDPAIKLRIVVEPLIVWLWIGGLIMLVGTGLSAFPGRRRNPLDPVSSPLREKAAT